LENKIPNEPSMVKQQNGNDSEGQWYIGEISGVDVLSES
jgi:hypothetical protein